MKATSMTIVDEEATPLERAESVSACLNFLYAEAIAAGSKMGAHLIGAASAAIDDEIRRGELYTPPAPLPGDSVSQEVAA